MLYFPLIILLRCFTVCLNKNPAYQILILFSFAEIVNIAFYIFYYPTLLLNHILQHPAYYYFNDSNVI